MIGMELGSRNRLEVTFGSEIAKRRKKRKKESTGQKGRALEKYVIKITN